MLSSGISCGDFSISVHEGGHALNFRVYWPTALLDVVTLHKKWLFERNNNIRIEAYHPKIVGFESFFNLRRKQASDIIEYSSGIPLPFAVDTHIGNKSNLAWKDGDEKIIYVDLKAPVEGHSVKIGSGAFERL